MRKHFEARLTSLEQGSADVQAIAGKLSDDYDDLVQENVDVFVIVKQLIEDFGQLFRSEVIALSTEVANLCNFVEEELHELHKKVHYIHIECQTHRKASSPTSTSTTFAVQGTHGIKVVKPDTFNGVRNATMVDNFLFSLESYIEALGINGNGVRISNASTFLRDFNQL